jgi:hypothetical protein
MREALARMLDDAAGCARAPVFALPDDDLLAAVGALHAVEQLVVAAKLGVVREIDGRGLAVKRGAGSTALWLWEQVRVTVPAARRLQMLAKDLDTFPAVADALAAGAVSVEQARVIVAAVAELPGHVGPEVVDRAVATLVEAAGQFDPSVLRKLGARILSHVAPEIAEEVERKKLADEEREARQRRGFTLSADGMGGVRLHGRLDAEAAAIVAAALDPLCRPGALAPAGVPDERSAEQRRADALVEVCRLALNGGDLPANGGDRPQVVVTVNFDEHALVEDEVDVAAFADAEADADAHL